MKKYILGFLLLSSFSFGLVSAQTLTDTVQDVIDCANITHNLKLGSRDVNTGGDVTTLQIYLSQANFLDSDPTGYFGKMTRAAVQAFQSANGISPLGSVGPLTRGKIQSISCGNSNTTINTTPKNNSIISVVSPNGGETLVMGNSYLVKWSVNRSNVPVGDGGFVGISLVGNNSVRCLLVDRPESNSLDLARLLSVNGTCYNDGSGMPVTITPGKYKIEAKIWINGVTTIDESDNYFEIVSASAGNNKTYSGAGFEIQYPENIFTSFQINKYLPPNYKNSYSGIKLISSARVGKIGKQECSYGESGIMNQLCKVEMESGIEFVQVNDSVQNLTSVLDNSKTTLMVAGKQAIKWSIGVEGAGAEYYYIPLSSDQTLVAVRIYANDGFPQQALLDQIFSTLKIK